MSTKRFIAKHGLDNNNQTITNVADPVNSTDVVIKRTTDNLSNTLNIAYNTANNAWAGANASYTYASSTANNAYITANNAWNAANTANTWLQANDYNTLVAAYANDSSTLTSSKLYTDNANNWLQANDVVTLNNSKNYSNTIYSIVSSTTNNAFDRANTAYSQANASYAYSSSTANNAYNTANSAWAGANASYTYASSTANNAYITANNAWNAANTANTWLQANDAVTLASAKANDYNTLVAAYANDSSTLTSSKLYTDNANTWLQANDVVTLSTAKNYSNSIYSIISSTANNAYITANNAWDDANAAFDRSNTAYAQANNSYIYASSTANNAYNTANSAWAGANASYTYASSTANNAYNTANNAWNQANNAFNRANTAYAQANNSYIYASSTANNAYNTANSAWDKANASNTVASSAYNNANSAYEKANSVNNIASSAYNTGNGAYVVANSAWAGANASYTYASSTANNAYNTANSAWATANSKLNSSGGVISGNLAVSGNVQIDGTLSISGNVFSLQANNLSITDNMIYLNRGANTANPDIGIAAGYNDGIYHHTGFFRDATDGIWKVFDNYVPEPDASVYIDTSNSTFRIANFQANVVYGNTFVSTMLTGIAPFSVTSTTIVPNLNVDYLDGNHGSYYSGLSNTVSDRANTLYSYASSTANNAYNTANNAWAGANASYTYASSTANNAYITANNAWNQANNAFNRANTAYAQANNSYIYASSTANNAYNTANNAWAGANASYTYASSTANNAYITANNAWNAANTANTYRSNASNLTTGTIPGDRGVTAGSATASFVEYNGTTATAGQFDGGSTAPSNSIRLNYDGFFYATNFYGSGTGLTGTATNLTANVANYEVITNATSGTYYPQLVSATSGTLAGYSNNAFVFDVTNLRLGIANTSPTVSLTSNGSIRVVNPEVQTFELTPNTYANNNIGILVRNESPIIDSTGNTYYGIVTNQKIYANSTSAYTAAYGTYNIPRVIGTQSGSRLASYGTINRVIRGGNEPLDIANNPSYTGLYGTFNQVLQQYNANANSSIVTGFAYGTLNTLLFQIGTIVDSYGTYNNFNIGGTTTASANATNYYANYSFVNVGSSNTALSTSTISNYYGLYLATPTVNATGAITNRWGIYQQDSAALNYFNGKVGIQIAPTTYLLDINGSTRSNTLILTANTASTNTTSGTLVVTGGVGISGNVNIGGDIQVGPSTILASENYTTSNTNQITLDSFPTSTYRTAIYEVQMTSTTNYHTITLKAIHNGTTVYLVQYGEIFTNISLGSFDASISSGNLNLLFTPTNAATTVKLTRQLILV